MEPMPFTPDLFNEASTRLASATVALESLLELLVQANEQATLRPLSLYELIQPAVSDVREAFNCMRGCALS
jgi:hypothetical protein